MKRAHCVIVDACSRLAGHTPALLVGLALILMASLPRPAFGQWSGTNPVWTNSNAGIGTTNPLRALHMARSGFTELLIEDQSVGNTTLGRIWGIMSNAGQLSFRIGDATYSNAPTVAVLTSSGNFGIGTTSPQSIGDGGSPTILQVHGGSNGPYPFGLLQLTTNATAAGAAGAITFGSTAIAGPQRSAEIVSYLTATSSTYATGNLTFYTANGTANLTEKMRITEAGNVGIGTTNPQSKLSVTGSSAAYNGDGVTGVAQLTTGTGINTDEKLQIGIVDGINGYSWLQALKPGTSVRSLILNGSGGGVGIGTTNPCGNSFAPANCKLGVAGAIQAQEVVVNTGWSDYVFEPGYHLQPLKEVGIYIAENHHLPGIPSDAEVKEKGVAVGEMESKLLAKVEELTLHLIQAEERTRELQERIARLENHQ